MDRMDVVMEEAVLENGHETNGFIDPRDLQQRRDDEDSLIPDHKSETSEVSLAASDVPQRKAYLPTGCCYDERMKLHANADFSQDPPHPEDPRRISAIMKEFRDGGLLYTGPESQLEEILRVSPTAYMYRIPARFASAQEICLVHTLPHFQWVESLSKKSSKELRDMTREMDSGRKSLYVGNLTHEAALISAGGAIETCKNVVVGNVKNAIAVIRPPGHHAERDEAMGFCIFNNVPIAARVCQQDFPELCRKVMILDWDVHHGNGVQNIFYNDPNVLYISLHVYQNGHFYPGAPEDPAVPDGGIENCGAGPGIGKNVNIGWHSQGMGDGEYLAAFQRIVMPIAQEFQPDLVIVSAGFDAAHGDELGGCFVTPACYAHMTHMLMSLAGGKLAVCLEGGYNLKAISRSALAVAQTLMGEPPPSLKMPPIHREADRVLQRVRETHAPYWDSMRPGHVDVKEEEQVLGGIRLNNVIRSYQTKLLSSKHKMISLYIQRERLARAFENQVLVTQGLTTAKKIILILHDPPEVLAIPDPWDSSVDSHNAWVNDGVMPYIDWAIEKGFGIIDVNMPLHIDDPDDNESNENGFIDRPNEAITADRMKELVCYLWDNYLEGYESTDIILMGVGDACVGVKMLLTNRDSRFKIRAVLNYVTGSLRPIKSETDVDLAHWYKKHSRVIVACNHACWEDEVYATKVRKSRFGRVFRSNVIGLNRMMAAHREESTQWITEMLEGEEE